MKNAALVWFRRDLRVADQPALAAAAEEFDIIVPFFILDPAILKARDTAAARVAFLLGALDSLQKNVAHLGGRLLIRQGKPEETIARLIEEARPAAIFWNRDYESYACKRDTAVEILCIRQGLDVRIYDDQCVHAPEIVLKKDGDPYTVFTPYSRAWRAIPEPTPVPPPRKLSTPASLNSEPLPDPKELGHSTAIDLPPPGERAALDLLGSFVRQHLAHYRSRRNFPERDATSRLSPHLRFGTISARIVLARARKALAEQAGPAAEIDTFISELIWRDFYKQILHHFPHVEHGCFRPVYDDLRWENNERLFAAWREGRTGYPIVDAAMRQLNTTGWMHNRLRMITASFLTKDLLIDWRWGERYFMQKLLDGDIAANNGGWQWAAGTGTDAQPFFRIFNPASQAHKFDPEGRFIETMIPEIDTRDYPPPVVDHSQRRLLALAMFKEVRGSDPV